ncbi:DUF3488 domain-containing transglutaminase family protein [bacterium]|nr:DUF3488 domain-containing transglutaminase family protein [bacterium]
MIAPDRHLPLLVANLLIAYLPHALQLPTWVTSWFFFFSGFLLLASLYGWNMPGKGVRYLLIGAGFLGIYLNYGHIIDSEASVGLLAVMTILKPFEIVSERDRIMTLFMTYFLVISGILNASSLVMSLYLVLCVLLTTTVLVHIQQPHGKLVRHVRLASIIVLQALPLTCLLFFLFPRFQGSLWGLNRAPVSQSGFSDTLAPGDISNLVINTEKAFRVEFKGELPQPEQLYFRGLVFLRFDGQNWHYGTYLGARQRQLKGSNPIEYSVVLEPHHQRWLFALDLPETAPDESVIREDQTLYIRHRVHTRKRYSLRSLMTYHTGALYYWENVNLQIPQGSNPEAYNLGRLWKGQANSIDELIKLAQDFFIGHDFRYTLNPPLLGHDAIDDFLFRSRQGFCEHYASAFAFLMRVAEVPARVVVGYLGGEYNPYGQYLNVRQSDAHAWVELWTEERGWFRVDPTSFIAPERIRMGLLNAPAETGTDSLLSNENLGAFALALRKISLGWDAINTVWYNWVIDYTDFQQQQFLNLLGLKTIPKLDLALVLILALLVTTGLGLLLLRIQPKPLRNGDKVRILYDQFCQKLARQGLIRHQAQGPADYARLVCQKRPDLATTVNEISGLYIKLRYQEQGDDRDIHRLTTLIKRLYRKQ